MGITIKPSDLQYKYPKDVVRRDEPKFSGKPDPRPFNRDDVYEIVPMLEMVMDELGSDSGRVLHMVETMINRDLPRFVERRDEVFDFLVGCAREVMGAER